MAANFTKWQLGLSRKRQILALSKRLRTPPQFVAGACMTLWEWVGEQSHDGVVKFCDASLIDEIAGLPGLADAMCGEEIAWLYLDVQTRTAHFAKWDEHNSSTAKSRALGAKRQSEFRDRARGTTIDQVTGERYGSSDPVTPNRHAVFGGPDEDARSDANSLYSQSVARDVTGERYGGVTRTDNRQTDRVGLSVSSSAESSAVVKSVNNEERAAVRKAEGITEADDQKAFSVISETFNIDAGEWGRMPAGRKAAAIMLALKNGAPNSVDESYCEAVERACATSSRELMYVWVTWALYCKSKKPIGNRGGWFRATIAAIKAKRE